MRTKITIDCPLEGLEGVKVTYDLMSSDKQVTAFRESLTPETAAAVLTVEGWPEDKGEPFGGDAPVAWMMWAAWKGYGEAIREFLTDPN